MEPREVQLEGDPIDAFGLTKLSVRCNDNLFYNNRVPTKHIDGRESPCGCRVKSDCNTRHWDF